MCKFLLKGRWDGPPFLWFLALCLFPVICLVLLDLSVRLCACKTLVGDTDWTGKQKHHALSNGTSPYACHVIVWKCPPSPGLWSFTKRFCFIFSHITCTFVQTSRSRNTATVTSNTGAVGDREFRCHHTACVLLCLFMFVCIMYLLELYIWGREQVQVRDLT